MAAEATMKWKYMNLKCWICVKTLTEDCEIVLTSLQTQILMHIRRSFSEEVAKKRFQGQKTPHNITSTFNHLVQNLTWNGHQDMWVYPDIQIYDTEIIRSQKPVIDIISYIPNCQPSFQAWPSDPLLVTNSNQETTSGHHAKEITSECMFQIKLKTGTLFTRVTLTGTANMAFRTHHVSGWTSLSTQLVVMWSQVHWTKHLQLSVHTCTIYSKNYALSMAWLFLPSTHNGI